MQHSDQPFIELAKAKEAISAMEKSGSPADFEEQWKEFLRRLERSWSKAQAHYGKSPKWNGWQGKIDRQRRTDALLSYLVNARGAEEHTVNEISEIEKDSIDINPAEGNSLFIEQLEIRSGVITTLRSPQKIRIDFIPGKMRLLPVINRGRTYGVPTLHLGKQINPEKVVEVARTAFGFYEKVIAEAEAKFVE